MITIKVTSPMGTLAVITIATTNPQIAGKVSITSVGHSFDAFMQDLRGLQGQPIGSFAIAADVVCAFQRIGIGTVEVEGDYALPPLPPGAIS